MTASSSCLPSVLLLLLAVALLVGSSQADLNGTPTYQPTGGDGSLNASECAPRCAFRCSKTSHQKPCLFFCNKCCQKCLCVPSGTYGNKEECPCYNNWRTQEGKPKCP